MLASVSSEYLVDWSLEVGPVEVRGGIRNASFGERSHCRAYLILYVSGKYLAGSRVKCAHARNWCVRVELKRDQKKKTVNRKVDDSSPSMSWRLVSKKRMQKNKRAESIRRMTHPVKMLDSGDIGGTPTSEGNREAWDSGGGASSAVSPTLGVHLARETASWKPPAATTRHQPLWHCW